MAKINEEKITIKISELIRDSEPSDSILDITSLEAIIQELVGQNRLVEITKE
jgi:hypothetical protein